MTEVFFSYEQDFCRYQNNINRILGQFDTLMSDKKEPALLNVKSDISDAEKCLKQMEMELSSMNGNQKQEYRIKIRRYKTELEEMRKKFVKEEGEIIDQKNRDNLMGGIELSENHNQKDQFIKEGQILSSQNLKLQEAIRTGLEAEKTAVDIQLELSNQTDKIGRNIVKTKDINNDLSESNSLIKGMADRIRQNKLIFWLVLGIIAIAVTTVIYINLNKSQTA